jgi:hypothetical protein
MHNTGTCLQLRFGESRRLAAAHYLVTFLALCAILSAPAQLSWKLILTALLLVMHFSGRISANRPAQNGDLHLFHDGAVYLKTADGQEAQAFTGKHGWASRWLSVLPLIEEGNGRRRYCVVCASKNTDDEYRRLLVWMRMNGQGSDTGRLVW